MFPVNETKYLNTLESLILCFFKLLTADSIAYGYQTTGHQHSSSTVQLMTNSSVTVMFKIRS